jgi:trk system potassium uptake protein TrkH
MTHLRRLPLLVIFAGLAALLMLLPAGHATIMGNHAVARAFFYSAIVIFLGALMVGIASGAKPPRENTRASVVAMVAGYAILPFLLAIPLAQMRLGIEYQAAWFDMLSAFTTTGAAPRYPELLPPTVTLWRGLVGWIGGFYILVMASAVLLPMGLGGSEVVSGKTSRGQGGYMGASKTPIDRILDTGLMIFPIYGAMTLILWLALALAGESSFAALVTAMGVISTSGIAAEAGGVAQDSGILGEMIIVLGLTIAMSRHLMPLRAQMGRQTRQKGGQKLGGQRLGEAQFYDPELRLGLAVVVLTSAALFVYHWFGRTPPSDATMMRAIWGGLVLALSFLTTTGFESYSTQMAMDWAGLGSPGMLLMGLAIMGGGVATTAGGLKLLRVYALLRHGERELERLVHPNSLGGAGQDARFIRRAGALNAWVLFMLFALTIGVGTAVMTLTGMDFDPSIAFTISALTNTGPLATSLLDLQLSYAALSPVQMAVLAVLMVAGRLELLVLLAVLSPSTWRF